MRARRVVLLLVLLLCWPKAAKQAVRALSVPLRLRLGQIQIQQALTSRQEARRRGL
jgi:hypothetical protein